MLLVCVVNVNTSVLFNKATNQARVSVWHADEPDAGRGGVGGAGHGDVGDVENAGRGDVGGVVAGAPVPLGGPSLN